MSGASEALVDYGWLIAGIVLLVLEVLAPGVYLLFFGVAAIIVGINVVIVGGTGWLGWEQQVVAFVVLSVVCVLLGRSWYGTNGETTADAGTLNRRTRRLVGREATLAEAISDGRGRVAIDDSWWTVSGPDLPRKTRVRITGADGSVLTVEPVERA